MDAYRQVHGAPWLVGFAPLAARLLRIVAATALTLLVTAGLLIAVRRATGSLSEPLTAGNSLATGLGLALTVAVFRAAFPPGDWREPRWAAAAIPSCGLLLWLGALPGDLQHMTNVLALLVPVALEEGWTWNRFRQSRQRVPARISRSALDSKPVAPPARLNVYEVEPLEESAEECTPDVVQHVVRRKVPGSGEMIEGWLWVEIAPGQRHATGHLAICPPLAGVPECSAEISDGPSSALKVAQVLPYGVRFEVKLDTAAAAADALKIEFCIQEQGCAED